MSPGGAGRFIKRMRLSVVFDSERSYWLCGRFEGWLDSDTGQVDGELGLRCGSGLTMEDAVEDWCMKHGVSLEKEGEK